MGTIWDRNNDGLKAKSMSMGVLSLLCCCYEKGVVDACNSHDEGLCREFIEKTDIPGNFGFLYKPREESYNLRTWDMRQFIAELITITMNDNVTNRNGVFSYMAKIINPSCYHFCLLHTAQEFYKQGMLDYMKYPNSSKLHTIMDNPRHKIWTATGAEKKDQKHTLNRMQIACFDRCVLCEEYSQETKNKYATKRSAFVNFQKSIWAALIL